MQCPQCAGEIELSGTKTVLTCSFCKSRLYMHTKGAFRFTLLPSGMTAKQLQAPYDLIYVPFWRYKGGFFRIMSDFSVDWSNFDSTICAIPGLAEHLNLGIRHQTVAMSLLEDTHKMPAPQSSFHESLLYTQKRFSTLLNPAILERFIGEQQSTLLYVPCAIKNTASKHYIEPLMQDIPPISISDDIMHPLLTPVDRRGATSLIPLLCPECGSDLHSQSRLTAIICNRCHKGWQMRSKGFMPLTYRIIAPDRADFSPKETTLWLPFWVTEARLYGLGIENRAEFNKTVVSYWQVGKDWHEKNMCFVTPAFNLAPKMLLKLSARMTIARIEYDLDTKEADIKAKLAPVTLSYDVSAKLFKFILAELFQRHKKIAPLIKDCGIKAVSSTLCYLPYTKKGSDLICAHTGNAISAQAFEIGQQMVG